MRHLIRLRRLRSRATADRAVSVEFQVGAYESSFSLQIWKVYGDEISIELISPGGIRSGTLSPVLGTARLTLGPTELLLFYGMPSPYSQAQEIYLTFQGAGNHLSVENRALDLASHPRPPDLRFL